MEILKRKRLPSTVRRTGKTTSCSFLIPHSFSAIPVGEGQEGVSP